MSTNEKINISFFSSRFAFLSRSHIILSPTWWCRRHFGLASAFGEALETAPALLGRSRRRCARTHRLSSRPRGRGECCIARPCAAKQCGHHTDTCLSGCWYKCCSTSFDRNTHHRHTCWCRLDDARWVGACAAGAAPKYASHERGETEVCAKAQGVCVACDNARSIEARPEFGNKRRYTNCRGHRQRERRQSPGDRHAWQKASKCHDHRRGFFGLCEEKHAFARRFSPCFREQLGRRNCTGCKRPKEYQGVRREESHQNSPCVGARHRKCVHKFRIARRKQETLVGKQEHQYHTEVLLASGLACRASAQAPPIEGRTRGTGSVARE